MKVLKKYSCKFRSWARRARESKLAIWLGFTRNGSKGIDCAISAWCSYAQKVEGDRVLCGNSLGWRWVSNEKDCRSCSVGVIRRLRDGWI